MILAVVGLVTPALATLVLGVPMATGQRRAHPRVAARTLTLATLGLLLATVAGLATVAFGFISGLPWIGEHLDWCRDFARAHDRVSPWLGLPAAGLLVVMVARAAGAYRLARNELWASSPQPGGLRIVEHDRPDAYALGGPLGHVVVSTGMLGLLDSAERGVLFAHERSHLRHRHHRYLALARVTTAAMPVLGFVTGRLRLAVERWADEDAADAAGGDRRLVARTIVRAALARTDHDAAAALALGAVGVRARVDALLSPGPARSWGASGVLSIALGAAGVVLLGAALQVHHLLGFVSHVCRL